MTEQNMGLAARAQRLGELLKDARQVKGQTPEACAACLGCDVADYLSFEDGSSSPSLPELEVLAYFLNVPLSYFWGERALSEQPSNGHQPPPVDELTSLRDRMIGAQIRQARYAAHVALPDLAATLGVPPEQLAAYEVGQWPVPLPELERAAGRLGLPLSHFFEATGQVGEWHSQQRAADRLRQLPAELREFVSQPVNEPYLRLAHRLSLLPADRLRGIAESILEITL